MLAIFLYLILFYKHLTVNILLFANDYNLLAVYVCRYVCFFNKAC